MKPGEPYIRKKGSKYIIERKRKEDGKTEYIKTLPDVRTLLNCLGVEASQYYEEEIDKKEPKASSEVKRLEEPQQKVENNVEEFVESTLTEFSRKTLKTELTKEEIKKEAWELANG